jgi:AsnC-type helix-turn-helix domain
MDSLDQHLLGILRMDARTSIAELSKKLGVSRGTVSNLNRKCYSKQLCGTRDDIEQGESPTDIQAIGPQLR